MACQSARIAEIRKSLTEEFDGLLDYLDALEERVADPEGEVDFESVEETISEQGRRVTAQAKRCALASLEMRSKHLVIDGTLHYRCMIRPTTYRTPEGEFRLERALYRPVGVHNGPTVSPMEARAGIIGRSWTPACARMVAHFGQQMPPRQAKRLADDVGICRYSESSFKRLTRRLGGAWEARRVDIEDAMAQTLEVPADAATLAVQIDRTSVLMKEDDGLHWRMAYCGALVVYDGDGEPLRTWRYGRLPHGRSAVLRDQMRGDAEAILEQRPDLKVVTLSDGAPEMGRILDEEFPDAPRFVDFYHLSEKLGAALGAIYDDPQQRELKMETYKMALLEYDWGIELVEHEVARWAEHSECEEVLRLQTYIANHREQMRYARARRQGFPVGTGHIEATCKQLIALRMKRNGQRWSLDGGQAVLNLRALAHSGRWRKAMDHLLAGFRRRVEPAGVPQRQAA